MDLERAKGIILDFLECEVEKKINEFGKDYFYDPTNCTLQEVEQALLLFQEIL